jgi:hypothetical protein
MEPVAEAVMGLVATLAAASYGHFGVTLKPAPSIHHVRTQRNQPIVQRLPASAASAEQPCIETVAERTVLIRKA